MSLFKSLIIGQLTLILKLTVHYCNLFSSIQVANYENRSRKAYDRLSTIMSKL